MPLAAFKSTDPDLLRNVDGMVMFAETETLGLADAALLAQLRAGLQSLQRAEQRDA